MDDCLCWVDTEAPYSGEVDVGKMLLKRKESFEDRWVGGQVGIMKQQKVSFEMQSIKKITESVQKCLNCTGKMMTNIN